MRHALSLSIVLLLGGCGSLKLADTGDAGAGTETPDEPGTRPDGGSSDDDDDVTLPDGGKSSSTSSISRPVDDL